MVRRLPAEIQSLKYDYDEVGNRRRIWLKGKNQDGMSYDTQRWYRYDGAGRVLVADGYVVNGKVVVGKFDGTGKGVSINYDASGRRVEEEKWVGTDSTNNVERFYQRRFNYDDVDHLGVVEHRENYRAINANTSDPYMGDFYLSAGRARRLVNGLGIYSVKATYEYDGRGRQTSSYDSVAATNGGVAYRHEYSYRGDGVIVGQKSYGRYGLNPKVLLSEMSARLSDSYDNAGNQVKYKVDQYTAQGYYINTVNYQKQYERYDSYKDKIVVASVPGSADGVTNFAYSGRGELFRTWTSSGSVNFDRRFASDRNGRFVAREENGKVQTYYYANGKQIASIGALVTAPEFDYGYEPISDSYPAKAPSSYVVNQGDTLESIALAVWGDAKMWYLIADANGLSSDADLSKCVGTSIKIPNVVTNIHNDADTFKPYNPQEIIGDTTPAPQPPPPPKQKCKALSQAIAVIVTIVVTLILAPLGPLGAAVGAAAGNLAGQYSSLMLNGQYDWKRMLQHTLNPLSGDRTDIGHSFSNPLAHGARGRIDYEGAAISAAAAAAASYVPLPTQWGAGATAAARAGISYSASYGMNKALDREAHFSLRELGASMTASYVSGELFGGQGQVGPNGQYQTNAFGDIRPFLWSNVVRDALVNVGHAGVRYLANKAFDVDGTHWDGQMAFAEAAASSLGNNYVGDWKYKRLPQEVKEAMKSDLSGSDGKNEYIIGEAGNVIDDQKVADLYGDKFGLVRRGGGLDAFDAVQEASTDVDHRLGNLSSAVRRISEAQRMRMARMYATFNDLMSLSESRFAIADKVLSDEVFFKSVVDDVRAKGWDSKYALDGNFGVGTKITDPSVLAENVATNRLNFANSVMAKAAYDMDLGSEGLRRIFGEDLPPARFAEVAALDVSSLESIGDMHTAKGVSKQAWQTMGMAGLVDLRTYDFVGGQGQSQRYGRAEFISGLATFGATSASAIARNPHGFVDGVKGLWGRGAGIVRDFSQLSRAQVKRLSDLFNGKVVPEAAGSGLRAATNSERQAALQRMAEVLRYRALGWNHEQGKFSVIETMAVSRAERAYGKRFMPSDVEGVDVIDPNGWGKVSLKGPFLNKNLQPLTIDQQMKAVSSIQKHVQNNTAVNTHIIDTMGLSDEALSSMQQSLKNAKIRIVYVVGE